MYNDVIEYLDQKRVKEALVQLAALAHEADNWKLSSEIENLQTTYSYMLQYASQGMEDPERNKLYHKLIRRAYELADSAEFIRKHHSGNGYQQGKYRVMQQFESKSFRDYCLSLEAFSEDLGMAQISIMDETQRSQSINDIYARHEKDVTEMFDKIWLSTHWTDEDLDGATAILESLLVPANDIAVMISAITLNLLQLFDSRKFQFLLKAYQIHSEAIVTQRALTGIALTAYYQEKRLNLYPELVEALSLLNDSTPIAKELNKIQIILLLSHETEKIEKKMREEIIPNMKISPEMMNPGQKIFDMEDLEDKNPEWEKEIKRVEEYLHERGALQSEGADTYMSAFSQLKSYPFFRQAAHWFYPFDRQQPDVAQVFKRKNIDGEKSIISTLMDSTMFCNSDKYSFCLTLQNIPSDQLELLATEFNMQNEMIGEGQNPLAEYIQAEKKSENVCRQYIHDLYRFFKLWMYRSEMHDIFTDDLALWKCEVLKPLIHTPESLKHIAEYLFSKEYFEQACEIYNELLQYDNLNDDFWRKTGFCYQKMKAYSKALQAYEQADLLKPDHVWTLKQMAQCNKRQQQYQKALECLYKIESMQPENLNLLLQIGQCLANLRMYDKALTYFFKVEYLDKAPANAQRAIGWCYFMTGKYDDANRFFDKLLRSDESQSSDWLNAGHVYLAQNNIQRALECYRHVESTCKTHDEFMKLYLADKAALLEQGILEENIYLVADML